MCKLQKLRNSRKPIFPYNDSLSDEWQKLAEHDAHLSIREWECPIRASVLPIAEKSSDFGGRPSVAPTFIYSRLAILFFVPLTRMLSNPFNSAPVFIALHNLLYVSLETGFIPAWTTVKGTLQSAKSLTPFFSQSADSILYLRAIPTFRCKIINGEIT